MSPFPKRQPMIRCTACRTLNDPARGSALCRNCDATLPTPSQPTPNPEGGNQ